MIKATLYKPIFHILLIIVLTLLAYSNTFRAPFHFDDEPNIINNPVIKDLNFYIEPSKAKVFKGLTEYPMLKQRYIGSLTFALNYRLHGLDVTGYHIFNISIHIINALLVYFLVVLTFSTPFLKHSCLRDYSNLIALFAALLFASHPIQTQSVTYIVQRFASLATLFYLLSLTFYVRFRLNTAVNLKSVILYVLSLISAVLATKTKEIAFTLPVVIALYEFLFFDGKIKRRLLYLVPLLLTMLIIPLSLTGLDKPIGDLIGDVSEATRVKTAMSRLDYMFTEFRVIVTYIRLIFLPINQNLDYDYPIYHSLFNPEVFLSFVFLLTIFGLGVYLFYRCRNSVTHTKLIAFGIFWFFVTLSVESSIIPLHVIFEHRIYLPSIGVFIVISTSFFMVVEKLRERWKSIESAAVLALTVIVVLTGATYARNIVWKDKVSLWEDVVRKSPKKFRGHYNLGVAYEDKGFIDKGIERYQIAIKLNPNYPEAHNNLGLAYESQGLIYKAVEHFQIAAKLNYAYSEKHNNLGKAYYSQGLIDKAIEHFQIAVKLNYAYSDPHNNLGKAYYSQGLINKAIEEYQIAIRLNPDWVKPHFNLGRIYLEKGDIEKARREFEKVLQITPQHHEARLFYNSIIQKK